MCESVIDAQTNSYIVSIRIISLNDFVNTANVFALNH